MILLLEPGSRQGDEPGDYATLISHNLKTGAIINKINYIFPVKCY
jgi:hypothetical protein